MPQLHRSVIPPNSSNAMNSALESYTHSHIPTGVLRRAGTVMIVDDEAALRTVGKAILSTLNLKVQTAASGEDVLSALESARQQQSGLPDVILLDLTMPGGMSGLDTFDKLQEQFPSIAVIACSGFFEEGAEDVCQRLGFVDMLAKPYTPDALLSIVRRALTRIAGDC